MSYQTVDVLLSKSQDNLTPQEQDVVNAAAFEMEVNNGGLDQFFYNSTGNRVAEINQSLKNIGALNFVRILQLGGSSCDRRFGFVPINFDPPLSG